MARPVPSSKRPSRVPIAITNKSTIYAAIWVTTFLATVASLSYLIYITPRFQDVDQQDSTPVDWLSRQDITSINEILANLGSTGARAYGAVDGVLLDSPLPAPQDPYLWTRVRDSNMVFKTLIDRFIRTGDQQLQLAINSFITAQASIQTVQSPSGTLDDGKGLAEPRFLPDITADPGNRGRPKHDGPALRAIALVTYGRWLFSNGYEDVARNVVWSILRNDLNYVAEFWSKPGLTFWSTPSNDSLSFFITAAHHRALVEGAAFAKTIGQTCLYCESQAPQILCKLQDYRWKVGEHYGCITADLAGEFPFGGRSGCDASTLLSAISNFDPEAGCNDETFQPCSQPMLRNHKEVVDQFRGWDINSDISAGEAVAIGRYPEDNHGNAWYPPTLAAAELLYASLYAYTKFGSITIGDTSLPFWTPIYAPARTGLFRNNASDPSEVSTSNALYTAMKSYADGFVEVVLSSIPKNGSLSEQFSRLDGKPLGAKHFSWSYGAWLSMMDRREGRVPASWNALGASHVPSNCSTGGVKGSYSPANDTQWPTFPCKAVEKVQVTFNVLRAVGEGEGVSVYGSVPELGNWDERKMVRMDGERYDAKRLSLWSVAVEIPPGTNFEYRYKVDGSGGMESKTLGFRLRRRRVGMRLRLMIRG